jgi:hypothetical protein
MDVKRVITYFKPPGVRLQTAKKKTRTVLVSVGAFLDATITSLVGRVSEVAKSDY